MVGTLQGRNHRAHKRKQRSESREFWRPLGKKRCLVRLTKPHFSSNLWKGSAHPFGKELSNGHRTIA